jgi:hypothetical protein
VIVPSKSVKKMSLGLVSKYGRALEPMIAIYISIEINQRYVQFRDGGKATEIKDVPLDSVTGGGSSGTAAG